MAYNSLENGYIFFHEYSILWKDACATVQTFQGKYKRYGNS